MWNSIMEAMWRCNILRLGKQSLPKIFLGVFIAQIAISKRADGQNSEVETIKV